MNDEKFSFETLCTLTDLPSRTVRYYIQRGLVDRPLGEKRGAYYTRRHLEQLVTIRRWVQSGLSLGRIRELLHDAGNAPPPPRRKPGEVSVWSHLYLGEGLELVIEPRLAGLSPKQVHDLATKVIEALEDVRNVTNETGEQK